MNNIRCHQPLRRPYRQFSCLKNLKKLATTFNFWWPRLSERYLHFGDTYLPADEMDWQTFKARVTTGKAKSVLQKPTARTMFANHLWRVLRAQSLCSGLCCANLSLKKSQLNYVQLIPAEKMAVSTTSYHHVRAILVFEDDKDRIYNYSSHKPAAYLRESK